MAGYKNNTQKSVAFLYTKNEISEKESLKDSSIWNSNNLGISVTNEVEDLYAENYKTTMKETGDDSELKEISCSYKN